MTTSKWVVDNDNKNSLVRMTTIKPRIDYALEIVDGLLEILVQHRQEVSRNNIECY